METAAVAFIIDANHIAFTPCFASCSAAGDAPSAAPEVFNAKQPFAVTSMSAGVTDAPALALAIVTAPAASDSETPRRANRDRNNRRPRTSRPWICAMVESVCAAIARRDWPSR